MLLKAKMVPGSSRGGLMGEGIGKRSGDEQKRGDDPIDEQ